MFVVLPVRITPEKNVGELVFFRQYEILTVPDPTSNDNEIRQFPTKTLAKEHRKRIIAEWEPVENVSWGIFKIALQ